MITDAIDVDVSSWREDPAITRALVRLILTGLMFFLLIVFQSC